LLKALVLPAATERFEKLNDGDQFTHLYWFSVKRRLA
jgi:hypothetical protein